MNPIQFILSIVLNFFKKVKNLRPDDTPAQELTTMVVLVLLALVIIGFLYLIIGGGHEFLQVVSEIEK